MPNTTISQCALCGAGRSLDPDPPLLAIWVNGRGWLADVSGETRIKPRLRDARWFNSRDEVEAAIAEIQLGKEEYTEVVL